MKIIKQIQIEDYRIIKSIKFSPKSINVLVGRNNTGKSSILEAIALLVTSLEDFKDSAEESIWKNLVEKKEYDPSYLIRIGAKKAKINGTVLNNDYSLLLEYFESGYPKGKRGDELLNFFEKFSDQRVREKGIIPYLGEQYLYRDRELQMTLDKYLRGVSFPKEFGEKYKKIIKETLEKDVKSLISKQREEIKDRLIREFIDSKKLVISLNRNGKLEGLYTYPENEVVVDYRFQTIIANPELHTVLRPYRGKKFKKIPIVANFQKSTYPSSVKDLHDLVVAEKKIEKTIEALKKRIEYLQDIRKAKDLLMVSLSYSDKALPLSTMGGGFISLLKLLFMAILAENGLVILEEPEVSLHPGFSDIIADEIILNSERSQFFISTHSLDLIKGILEKAQKHKKLDSINIIRLHWRNDIKSIEQEILSGKDAIDEIEAIGTDLRGY